MLLETNELGKRFGALWALRSLDLEVEEGEVHGIIGPNGSGKSTLFNLIMGRYPATKGRLRFEGQDILRMKPHDRVRLGITIKFQVTNIFPGLTVRNNVRLGSIGPDGDGDGDLDGLLASAGLEEKGEYLAGELSHGEQQWLEIAMAIAGRPRLLLLDEPTSGMGPEETHQTAELIRSIKRGLTLLVIEHDMDFVRDVCDRITVLDRGDLIAAGTYTEVREDKNVVHAYLGKGR